MSKTKNAKKTTAPKPEKSATETPHVAAVPEPAVKPVKVAKEGKAKTPKVEKVAKPVKKTLEPKQKVPLRTVALRLPEADFEMLHKAAGPRQLANFMRETLLTAAQKSLSK